MFSSKSQCLEEQAEKESEALLSHIVKRMTGPASNYPDTAL